MIDYNHMIFNISIYLSVIIFISGLIFYANKKYKKKPKKSHFNYRVGTRITKTPIRDYREYLIFTCYYKNGVPNAYGISSIGYYDDVEDMKKTFDNIQKAFNKEIIDLENFPSVFVPEKD